MKHLAALFLLISPITVSAHASMESLYATTSGYLIDIGYDPAQPQVGSRLLLDIALREATESGESGPIADFDSVWVRMSRERATYFASGIAQSSIGPTTLVMSLPEAAEGPMTLSLRFEKDGEPIAEHEFDLAVAPAPQPWTMREYALGGALACALACIAFLARRYAQGKPVHAQ